MPVKAVTAAPQTQPAKKGGIKNMPVKNNTRAKARCKAIESKGGKTCCYRAKRKKGD